MKDNGGELTEASDDPGGGPMTLNAPAPADAAKQNAAWEKCRPFLPDGGNVKPMSTEQLEAARRFAKCMRDKGITYPDPDPSSGGGDDAARLPDGIDIQDPAVRRKLDECTVETNQLGGPSK
nr:hypothetical protein [Kibdelosporangium sp. MJ126-NF4]CTQ92904.1 hypothetical protein [Kibdelosporangium sp. MJ126-NF4]